MSVLRGEIETRFPEIRDSLHDGDGNYTLMQRVIEWLRSMQRNAINAEVVERVQRFKDWCEEQPRTQGAEDDIWTIFIVGFWEHLFESDSTRILIPKLMSRDEVIANRTYLESWVGAENYRIALQEYDRVE